MSRLAQFAAVCLLCPLLAQAQDAAVRGVVQDQDGQPLIGANVSIVALQRGAATGVDGSYEIDNLPPGTHLLRASMVGFVTAEIEITLTAGQVHTQSFRLEATVITSGEVVVTAGRREQEIMKVPMSISVLPTEFLEQRNVVALDEAIRYVSGVQVQGNQVNVRGSSGFSYNVGSRVLLLIDGMPQLTPDVDGVPFDGLPFSQVKRIEVVKGPGSALYGSGALGGVINVLTKDFPDTPETLVRAFGGGYVPVRYDEWKANWPGSNEIRPIGGFTFAHARKMSDKFGFWVNLDARHDAGFMRLNEKTAVQTYIKLGWRPSNEVQFDILANTLWRDKDDFLFWNGARDALEPGSLNVGQSNRPTGTNDNRNLQFTLLPTYTRFISNDLFYKIKVRLYGIGIKPITDAGKPREFSDGTVGLRYGTEGQVNWQPREQSYFTGGASFDALATRSSFFLSSDGDEVGNQPEGAIFGQWEESLTSNLTLVAGARADFYSIDAEETLSRLSPKLNLSYQASPRVSFRIAFGQGFRIPSLGERFVDNSDFFPIVRNLRIRPEISTSYEAGIRTALLSSSQSSLILDAAGFWNTYEGLIELSFVRAATAFQFVNLNKARIGGFEAGLEAALFNNRITARMGYTFLDAWDQINDAPLPFRPDHLLTFSGEAQLTNALSIGLDARYTSKPESVNTDFARFVPDAETLTDIRVVDARIGLRFGTFEGRFILRNAMEYYYLERPALLGPPRHAILQLQKTF